MADKNMAEKYEALRAAIAQHKGEPGALMPVLQAAQNIFGYVPEDVQKLIAEGLGCTLSEVYGVATFYSQFSLEPFELNVQGIERTFIDKLFAVGDYYLDNKVTEHSRHIYDLFKLFAVVEINDSVKELFELVRKERSRHAACLSAQEGVNLKDLLQKIIDESAYKNDYEAITAGLLFEKISYVTAIGALQKIINSGLLDE